jgi:hypothetical protein
VFKNKHYPIVLIPDSIAAAVKARNTAQQQVDRNRFSSSRAAINLPDNIANDRASNLLATASNLSEPATTKKWLSMPVLFSYLACLTALLVAMQFALAALLTAAFCFYCCWRSISLTKTARSPSGKTVQSRDFKKVRSERAQILQSRKSQTVPTERTNTTANTHPIDRSKTTANTHPNKIVNSPMPSEQNIEQSIAAQLKNIEAQAILQLKQIAANAIEPLQIKATAQEGATEAFFLSRIKEFLPGLHAVQGVPFAIPGSKLKYSCDFIAVHPATGIAADIEIDEPYVATSSHYGLPHHCFDCARDGRRNQFFLRGNWIVIRFAEEQIALQPAACCKLIASVFAGATGDLKILEPLNSFPDLLPVKQWNSQTASAMAKRNYRQTYLVKAGINLVNSAVSCGRNKRRKRHRR